MSDIVTELRQDADTAEGGNYPEDGCRWAITMRSAALEIERLNAALIEAQMQAQSWKQAALAKPKG